MRLTDLRIRLMDYGPNDGKYIAKVTMKDDKAGIEIELTPEITNRVLGVCVDQLCAAADGATKDLKDRLTASVTGIQTTLQLPRPMTPQPERDKRTAA